MIKEREYLLIILVPVFDISISYIYILIRGRDGFLGFGTVLGCFEAGTLWDKLGQCPKDYLEFCPGALGQSRDSSRSQTVPPLRSWLFGGSGDGCFFQGGYCLLEWWCSGGGSQHDYGAGFDFQGQMW